MSTIVGFLVAALLFAPTLVIASFEALSAFIGGLFPAA